MRHSALLLTLALAACVEGQMPPTAGQDPAISPPSGACPAPSLQNLVGRPETVLQTMRFGSEIRIIHPGTAVTMDYREERMNIEIDKTGTISRVTCG